MNDCLKIIFTLDGSGLHYDPNEPIHLDSLIAWVLACFQATNRHLMRDEAPDSIALPLYKRGFENGQWVWCASALFPEGPSGETIRFFRKRLRVERIEITSGSPNLTNGIYRDWNVPLPLLLTHKLVGYARGNRREVLKALRRITSLGKKRAHGLGKVVSVSVDRIDEDRSVIHEGRTMRWVPHPTGWRLVRLRPPYWNCVDRVACLEIGELFDQSSC